MSYFILYFEQNSQNNKPSHGQLNIYSIDREITEGRIPIRYNKMNIEASVIASRLDASLFYVFKKPVKFVEIAQRIRGKLFEFIRSRIDLKIDPYLFVFDLTGSWPKQMEICEKSTDISFLNLEAFFMANVKIGLFKIVE